jgi:hypothetical protein
MPARLSSAGVGLRGFIAWWSAGLRAWLPLRWQRLLSANSDRLLLQVQGDGVNLRRQRDDSVRDVAAQFGGGGHKNAAGATLGMDAEQALEALFPHIRAIWN